MDTNNARGDGDQAESSPTEYHRVVAAVVHKDGRVLLCHRRPDRPWYPNVWDLPGGHVNAAEPAASALARELYEELGIRIDPPNSEPVLARKLSDDTHLTVWAVSHWSGEVTNFAPDEHDSIGWFSPSELSTLELADPAVSDVCTAVLDHR